MKFATDAENQAGMVETLKRLPGNAEAFGSDVVTSDPLLRRRPPMRRPKGVAQPVQLEMRCVFDADDCRYPRHVRGQQRFRRPVGGDAVVRRHLHQPAVTA